MNIAAACGSPIKLHWLADFASLKANLWRTEQRFDAAFNDTAATAPASSLMPYLGRQGERYSFS